MSREITFEDLVDFFENGSDEDLDTGFYVSYRVRRRFYLERQNKVIRNGAVFCPHWVDLKNNVYYVSSFDYGFDSD